MQYNISNWRIDISLVHVYMRIPECVHITHKHIMMWTIAYTVDKWTKRACTYFDDDASWGAQNNLWFHLQVTGIQEQN